MTKLFLFYIFIKKKIFTLYLMLFLINSQTHCISFVKPVWETPGVMYTVKNNRDFNGKKLWNATVKTCKIINNKFL